jgi:hypothetical protein
VHLGGLRIVTEVRPVRSAQLRALIVFKIGSGRWRFQTPLKEVAGVKGNAEEIRGNETKLGGAHANDADDSAIESGDDPAMPQLPANEDGGQNGQDAGNVIQSDVMEHLFSLLEHKPGANDRFFAGSRKCNSEANGLAANEGRGALAGFASACADGG